MTLLKNTLTLLSYIFCISINAQELSFPKDSSHSIMKLSESNTLVQNKIDYFQRKSNTYKFFSFSGAGLAVLSTVIWALDANQNSNNYTTGIFCVYGVSLGSAATIFGFLKHASYQRKYKNLSENPNEFSYLLTKGKISKDKKMTKAFYEYKSQKYETMRNIGIGTTFAGLGLCAYSYMEYNRLQNSRSSTLYPVDMLASFGIFFGTGIAIGGGTLTTIGQIKMNKYNSYTTSTLGINRKGEFSFCYNF
jgi:hypothetical protein